MLVRTFLGVAHFLKSVELDIGTSPELDEVEYAYQTPPAFRMRPGSGKSLLITAPWLTVRFTGVADDKVVKTPKRARRRVAKCIVLLGGRRGCGVCQTADEERGRWVIEQCAQG